MTRLRSRVNPVLGFTLVELLVTLALVSITAAVAVPLATVIEARSREAELRAALRAIRQALDAHKAAADAGLIEKTTGASGYPRDLNSLVMGVPRTSSAGFNATPMVFLRQLPRDPFYPDRATPASQTWNIRAYGSPPGDFTAGRDVFDISSKSDRAALDGSRVSGW